MSKDRIDQLIEWMREAADMARELSVGPVQIGLHVTTLGVVARAAMGNGSSTQVVPWIELRTCAANPLPEAMRKAVAALGHDEGKP